MSIKIDLWQIHDLLHSRRAIVSGQLEINMRNEVRPIRFAQQGSWYTLIFYVCHGESNNLKHHQRKKGLMVYMVQWLVTKIFFIFFDNFNLGMFYLDGVTMATAYINL